MIKITTAKEVSYEASQKMREIQNLWAQYPTDVNQTMYSLVYSHLETLQTLIRLAGEVEE